MESYTKRYKGSRWALAYGAYSGISATAVKRLYGMIQHYLPYVIRCEDASQDLDLENDHWVLVGTPTDNRLIGELAAMKQIEIIQEPESYTITCLQSPWNPDFRLLVLAGMDEQGVLYATSDFQNRVMKLQINPDKPTKTSLRQSLDSLQDFTIQEYPRIQDRGIWSWGYVIYDYRRFIDNMVQLRLNVLTIWNDCLPVNIHEIIDYARQRGVKIVLGFHWGWGNEEMDLSNPGHQKEIREMVLHKYMSDYRNLNIQGIYFQTITEHHQTELGGRTLAEIVCEMVNDIGKALLKETPDLRIYFGLHATSIRQHYPDLKNLDPRITIVWEDAGAIPFADEPECPGEDDYKETVSYSRNLARFRTDTQFAIVAKGWAKLDWLNEFEHHDSFLLGERTADSIAERCRARQPHWDRINDLWLQNYRYAVDFYRAILDCKPSSSMVMALIEDGLFEERIQSSVALFGQTVWNPYRSPDDILRFALGCI